MAGDWLKVENATPDKPEVWAIADHLGLDPDAVFGKLFRVWAWFDEQSRNGHAPSVTKMLLDRQVGVTGFCDAMESVGWMRANGTTISIPNFDRHNGKTAKNRALANKRKRKERHDDVTVKSRKQRDKSVTREEKNNNSISLWGDPPEGVDSQAWIEWAGYKKGKPADGTLTKTANFLLGYSPDQQRQIVDASIRNAWKGLFEPKNQPPTVGPKLKLLRDAG